MQARVDSRVVVANGGVGDVESANVEGYGTIVARKQIQADSGTGIEIDLCGVSRWEILVSENHASDGFEERGDLLAMGEVVFEYERVDDCARRSVTRIIELVERQNFRIPLERSPQYPSAVLLCEYAANSAADAEHVDAAVLVKSRAANGE